MRDAKYDKAAGPRLFQTLAADGAAEGGTQFSLPRKIFVLFVTALLFVAAPLAWVSSASGSNGSDDGPQAVLVKSGSDDDDEQDDDDDTNGSGDSGKGKDDDTDDSTDTRTGTKTVTKSGTGDSDDDTGGGTQTRGKTGEKRDNKTGKETQNKDTDRTGLDTGKSTRGETDPGDKTGKTERV
jgi:hypothetical protein